MNLIVGFLIGLFTSLAAVQAQQQSIDLYTQIVQTWPNVCSLNSNVAIASLNFNTPAKNMIKEILETMNKETQRSMMKSLKTLQTSNLDSVVSYAKIDQIFYLLGLDENVKLTDICTYEARVKLRDLTNSLSASEKTQMSLMISNLRSGLQTNLPEIYAKVFAENNGIIKELNRIEPNAMKTITPILSSFYDRVMSNY